jgi:pilus assembly protein CpaB
MQNILSSRLVTTRGGTIALGAAAAVLAGIILLVYLNGYRNSVKTGTEPMPVLVAKSLIPKGTAGTLIGTRDLFQATTVPKDQLKVGALTDPAALKGRVTAADVYPGQQLTVADFLPGYSYTVPAQITGAERAIGIAVDQQHGLIGAVQAGDHVDAYVFLNVNGNPVVKLLAPNVLVLAAPAANADGLSNNNSNGSTITLRVKTGLVGKFALAADNGKLWMVLRPQVGAAKTKPDLQTVQTLLFGGKPIGLTGGR